MRLFLALLVMSVQWLGPWLCSCGPIQESQRNNRLPHRVNHCPCCPPVPAPVHAPKLPAKCPCCLDFVAITTSATLRLQLAPLDRTPSQTLRFALKHCTSVSVNSYLARREIPTFTTDDKLYAHHVLCC